METIKGIYTQAEVYAEDMEDYARAQIRMICDNEAAKGSMIRVMPDVHPGKVGPVGLTMTVKDKILPGLIGVDIGCGMTCAVLKEKRLELQKLDKLIRGTVPAGAAARGKAHHKAEEFPFEELCCHKNINREKALRSLGTLGGGNHFIELDKGSDGELYLIVHSGSRHLGKEVEEHYLRTGAKRLKEKGEDVPYPMTYLEGELMEQYIHDVALLCEYARLNREIILWEITKGMKLKVADSFSSCHNYVEKTEEGSYILRKGAASAKKGEKVIIPVNMKDGVLLGTGKGNPDWNCSAPHGSGRTVRRDSVKDGYTVSAFRREMEGIYCSCVGEGTLDEAPAAYRRLEQILPMVGDTVTVERIITPVYNFKAGNERRGRG